MASVSTYLNFPGTTEAAFQFYRSVFGTEFDANGIMRMGDVPSMPGQPALSDADKRLVMHVCLPILGGHLLMGTDVCESLGQTLTMGNNSHINLQTDTRREADQLFEKLAAGGRITMPLQEMFWGTAVQIGVIWNCRVLFSRGNWTGFCA